MDGSRENTCASETPAAEGGAGSPVRWWLGKAFRLVGAIVLLVLIGRHLLTGLDDVPFHVDEDAYLSASYLYGLFVRERRWSSWYWHRARTHEAPPVSRYVVALGLDLAGEPLETSPHKLETWWDTQHRLPKECLRFAPSTLRAGRRMAAVASVGSCAALLLLAWRALGWSSALATTALLGWNPLLALSGRRAMSDGPLLFCWMLTVLLPVAFFRVLVTPAPSRHPWRQGALIALFALLQGTAIGLAVGTKYSAGLTAIVTGVLLMGLVLARLVGHACRERGVLAFARAWLADRLTALLVLAGVLAAAAAAISFVAPNPGLYADPVGRTRAIVGQFDSTAGHVRVAFAHDALHSRAKALRSVVRSTLLDDYVSFRRLWPIGLYPGLCVLGAVALLAAEVGGLRRREPSARIVVALWIAVTSLGIVAWLPMDWDRYYLPLIPCVCVLVGHGAVTGVGLGIAGVRAVARARKLAKEQPNSEAGAAARRALRWCARLAGLVAGAGAVCAFALLAWPKLTSYWARRNCEANLRTIAAALKQYQRDTGELPPWLSCLYPQYIADKSVFICPCDPSHGAEGGVPPWAPGSQFPETDDTPDCKAVTPVLHHGQRVAAARLRNPAVPGCSYLYEYCAARCSWWPRGWFQTYPDLKGNNDGVVSWREAKSLVEQRGLGRDGRFDPARALGGDVPIVRCFWHTSRQGWETDPAVLNVRVGDGSIYRSDASADGWKRAARAARVSERPAQSVRGGTPTGR